MAAFKPDIRLHPSITRPQKEIIFSKSDFILADGVAGTGKTYAAIVKAGQWLRAGDIEKIVIIRSAVSVRSIGFLPGDEDEKSAAYAAPYKPLFASIFPKTPFSVFESKHAVEFELTSFLRGTTYDDTCIILDEFQNLSRHELETVATRVGTNTRFLVCGDTDQTDLPAHEAKGHESTIDVFRNMPEFQIVNFGIQDIVRSGFVKSFYVTRNKLAMPVISRPVGDFLTMGVGDAA